MLHPLFMWGVTILLINALTSREYYMMTSSNGNNFRVTGHFCGKFTGHRHNSPHECQWRGAVMLSLIDAWINGWVNNHEAGDSRRHRVHFDVTEINVYGICYCSLTEDYIYIYIYIYTRKEKGMKNMGKQITQSYQNCNWHSRHIFRIS